MTCAGAGRTISKFSDPDWTAKGEPRASVVLTGVKTLWFNTGTLCNLACTNCYIESTPRNDRLVYLSRLEVMRFLEEALRLHPELEEIGITGGEPFMNPHIDGILEDALATGRRVLVLTNAMRPMQKEKAILLGLQQKYSSTLSLRVSMDHFTAERHEEIRGPRSFASTVAGLRWLADKDFSVAVACRLLWADESEQDLRSGFAILFAENGITVDAHNPHELVLFPEMDANAAVPEITEACWGVLGKSPRDIMCASSRMVVKHKGAATPSVISCTLLPYESAFNLGPSLETARRDVRLNHPHCARFCVLGGASCSG